jgi:hypothetical protein
MNQLTGCVHARIGATGTVGADWMVGNEPYRRLDHTLYAGDVTVPLQLPATVVATVVLNPECYPLLTGLAGASQCPPEASALPPSGCRYPPR